MNGARKPGSLGAADCLSLLAAPTFAVMALVTALGGSPLDMLCSASPIGGMVPMYVLMSVFHAGPWLRLVSRSKRASPRGARRPSGGIRLGLAAATRRLQPATSGTPD